MQLCRLSLACITLFISACATPQLELEVSDHFNGEIFHNLGETGHQKSFSDFLKWRFFGDAQEWPEWLEIQQQIPQCETSRLEHLCVTFINHASVLIQIDGVNILTDPIYSDRASPFSFMGPKRVKLPGVAFDNLPTIDLVMLSHNHYDSFDIATLERLIERDQVTILAGIGNSYYMDEQYQSFFVEMDWLDSINVKGIDITFLPSKHWSRRSLNDINKSLWGAFAIVGSKKVYFAGDTGYSDHFAATQQQFEYFDLSLIPIGAYEPRWFMKQAHMNPAEAVKAHLDLHSVLSVAIHFGTFQLTDEAIDQPGKDLYAAKEQYGISDNEFVVLTHGQSKQVH